jgi:phosphoglycerate kinase
MTMHGIDEIEDVKGKRALVRVDFNVPLDDEGHIGDDRRIEAALPTLKHLRDEGAAMVLATHLGRPKGEVQEKLRLDRVADRLRDRLGGSVAKVNEVAGDTAREAAERLEPGGVLLLENVRFDAREKKGDEGLGRSLAALADFYVNDAFATSHRAHASMVAAAEAFPADRRYAGLLVKEELEILRKVREAPAHPFVLILGGAKVSDKLGVVRALLDRVDRVLLGGPVALTVMKAKGIEVGRSLVDDAMIDEAKKVLEADRDGKIALPVDHVIEGDDGARRAVEELSPQPAALDVGPATLERWRGWIDEAKTVVWNGPLGKFEDERYREGTRALAEAVAGSAGTTVVGGGETGEAMERFGLADEVTHVSTGGGAFLKYLEKGTLPALEVLDADS